LARKVDLREGAGVPAAGAPVHASSQPRGAPEEQRLPKGACPSGTPARYLRTARTEVLIVFDRTEELNLYTDKETDATLNRSIHPRACPSKARRGVGGGGKFIQHRYGERGGR
jgi:hypothetical protein